jgi:hypothetical protein
MPRTAFVTVVLLALWACGERPRPGPSPAPERLEESAAAGAIVTTPNGTRQYAVESLEPIWPGGVGWQVDEARVVEIARGPGGEALDDVRAVEGSGADRVAIAVGSRVWIHDGRGEFVRELGGPDGAFGSVVRLDRCGGDTLAVADTAAVHFFGPDGRVGRTQAIWTRHHDAWSSPQPVGFEGMHRRAAGVSGDCARVLTIEWTHAPNWAPTYPIMVSTWWLSADSAWDASVNFPLRDHRWLSVEGRGTAVPPPFHRPWSWTVQDDRVLWVADVISPGYLRIDELRTIWGRNEAEWGRALMWRTEPDSVTAADRELFARRAHAAAEHDPVVAAALEAGLAPVHGRKADIAKLTVDDQGFLWVQAYPTLSTGWPEHLPARAGDEAQRWWVFGRDGRLLGTVSMPSGFDLHVVRGRRALGVFRDERGSTSVRVYPLTGR